MSGATCPECGCPFLRPVGKPGKANFGLCEYCGVTSDLSNRPRKMLTSESYQDWQKRVQNLKEGILFILTIEILGDNRDVTFDIMNILKLSSMSSRKSKDKQIIRVELKKRPADEDLTKIRALKGVGQVSVRL